ncbi:hypothetical protein QUA27_02315 [Microcoleus sp. Pol14C6]|uniref:hypothetical protein n=1 Tax=unclassified Microcoleus TaxID=2642155 RepID=UPI002FD24FDB
MVNLIYNGIEITIENKQVSLTNLYSAIGKPPNKAPTNFRKSKEGKQKINEYVRKYGTWVWKSRRGVDTIAIVELPCAYLEYLSDPKAAIKILEVYTTGQNIKYNTQNFTQNIEYNTENFTQNIEYNTERKHKSITGCSFSRKYFVRVWMYHSSDNNNVFGVGFF